MGLVHMMRKWWVLRGEPEQVFRRIAQTRFWNSQETVSGVGSTLAATWEIRQHLPALLHELGVKTMLDAGCGDCNWIASLDLSLDHYTGVDIVPEIIDGLQARFPKSKMSFQCGDISRVALPRVDLVLARDSLVHLPNTMIEAFLDRVAESGSTWLLATNFGNHRSNPSIRAGDWRAINLEAPPFNLPPPSRLLSEARGVDDPAYADKCLALWPVAALSNRSR
ncbi:MAG: class I SAM-dependent methyltransferase [Alphaproteobacteria bacterium]|nr:class I SAM-dependent methyltransferase [Alphaproteobacteria bacterium]